MSARSQIEGERDIAIGEHVPPDAVKLIAFYARNLDSLPGEPQSLPCLARRSPCQHGMMSHEEKQLLTGEWAHLQHRAILDLLEFLRLGTVYEVSVASR